MVDLKQGDCLDLMKDIPDKSVVLKTCQLRHKEEDVNMDGLLQEVCREIAKEYDNELLSLLEKCGVKKNEIKERCKLKYIDGVDIICVDGIPRIMMEEILEYQKNYIVCKRRLSLIEIK